MNIKFTGGNGAISIEHMTKILTSLEVKKMQIKPKIYHFKNPSDLRTLKKQ